MKNFPGKILNKIVAVHLICWSLFISCELGFLYFTQGRLEPFYIYFAFYTLNISFFYLLIRILNFTFNGGGSSFLLGILIYLLSFAIYLSLKFLLEHFLEMPDLGIKAQFAYFRKFIATNLQRGFYFTILATFYWAAGHIAFFKKRAAVSERRQLIAERDKLAMEKRLQASQNAYLKQQMNPHLLFNALNFIYGSVRKSSGQASECVLLLSDIMRFSLKETDADGKIPLAEEIHQLKNLVKLNNLRFDEPPHLIAELVADTGGRRIIPLILFSLAENVIKHGNLTDPANPALIYITIAGEGRLHFHSRNLKKNGSDQIGNHGIGLQNVRIRLDYAYPGRHVLHIAENDDFYELSLKIEL